MARLLRLTTILLLTYAHTAVALEYGNPGAAGLLPDRLERVDRLIEKTISDDKIKGAVALVARNGQIVYHKAFGLADAESKTSMATDSIFRIASMTKTVTTVAAMMLYENGHFQLNDPISLYLPEFADMRVITDTI